MLRASLSRAGCRCGSTARWPRRRSTISAATIATGSCRLATSTSPRARTVSTPRRRSSAWPRSPTLSRIAPRRRRRGTRCRASRRARISPRRSCRACADAARDERLLARHRSDSRLALGDLLAAVRVGHERLAGRSALRGRSDARRLARIERPRDEIEEARLQAVITEAEPAEIADEPRGLRGAIDVAEQPELELPILIAGLSRPSSDHRVHEWESSVLPSRLTVPLLSSMSRSSTPSAPTDALTIGISDTSANRPSGETRRPLRKLSGEAGSYTLRSAPSGAISHSALCALVAGVVPACERSSTSERASEVHRASLSPQSAGSTRRGTLAGVSRTHNDRSAPTAKDAHVPAAESLPHLPGPHSIGSARPSQRTRVMPPSRPSKYAPSAVALVRSAWRHTARSSPVTPS